MKTFEVALWTLTGLTIVALLLGVVVWSLKYPRSQYKPYIPTSLTPPPPLKGSSRWIKGRRYDG